MSDKTYYVNLYPSRHYSLQFPFIALTLPKCNLNPCFHFSNIVPCRNPILYSTATLFLATILPMPRTEQLSAARNWQADWAQWLTKSTPALLLLFVGLAFSNPSLSTHRESVLRPRADQLAREWAETDRRTIEREAAQAVANYTANRADAPDLTFLSLLKTIPYLPSYLDRTRETDGQSFPERLALWKHRALLRVSEAHDATTQTLLAKLSVHTTRSSYGVISIFSTCYEGNARRYVALAGQFVELSEEPCAPEGTH